jgi:hypothetical protein
MKAKLAGLAAVAALGVAACEDGSAPGMEEAQPVVSEARQSAHPLLVAINRKLEARRAKVRVPWIEYRTATERAGSASRSSPSTGGTSRSSSSSSLAIPVVEDGPTSPTW